MSQSFFLMIKQLRHCVYKNSVRYLNTNRRLTKQYQEISIPVPWGHIAGKWWGPDNKRPILTLHGWQDNCGSFNRLIPLLLDTNLGFLTIDLPGHGYSSRLPSGVYYHFTNYIILIEYLNEYFKWNKVSLMGHSLGGVSSFVYSMLYPDNVDLLICIDGSKPMITESNASRIARNINKFLFYEKYERQKNIEPPSYTIEEIKKKITTPNKNSVHYDYAYHLAERNILPSNNEKNKYYFTRDPRLKVGELMVFSQSDTMLFAEKMTSPMLLIKSKQSSYYENKENFYDVLKVIQSHNKNCIYKKFDGTHHLHLNNPETISDSIKEFIFKYNLFNRNSCGILENIKVKNC